MSCLKKMTLFLVQYTHFLPTLEISIVWQCFITSVRKKWMVFNSWTTLTFNPFPNKPWLLFVCSTSLLKTLREKEKLLIMSNFSFSHSVFTWGWTLCHFQQIRNCRLQTLSVWKSLKFVVWERVNQTNLCVYPWKTNVFGVYWNQPVRPSVRPVYKTLVSVLAGYKVTLSDSSNFTWLQSVVFWKHSEKRKNFS